jgi:hypothetical protein
MGCLAACQKVHTLPKKCLSFRGVIGKAVLVSQDRMLAKQRTIDCVSMLNPRARRVSGGEGSYTRADIKFIRAPVLLTRADV